MASTELEDRQNREILDLFPRQGDWTVEEYLRLDTMRLVEFTQGFLEILPMPDEIHQDIAVWIHDRVREFLAKRGAGVTKPSPFKIRIDAERFREPDICILLDENDPRRAVEFWGGADVCFEVVSRDNPARDYARKRIDYAAAAVKEYWIVDPQTQRVTLLELAGTEFVERGVFVSGQTAVSSAMNGFTLDVSACFAAAANVAKNRQPL